ncbi:MAG: hypothetical protein AAFQ07_08035 [Chloroflexota bacterium]
MACALPIELQRQLLISGGTRTRNHIVSIDKPYQATRLQNLIAIWLLNTAIVEADKWAIWEMGLPPTALCY